MHLKYLKLVFIENNLFEIFPIRFDQFRKFEFSKTLPKWSNQSKNSPSYLFWISIKKNKVNLIHIESRPSKTEKGRYEFIVDCKAESQEKLLETVEQLKTISTYLHILSLEAENDGVKESG